MFGYGINKEDFNESLNNSLVGVEIDLALEVLVFIKTHESSRAEKVDTYREKDCCGQNQHSHEAKLSEKVSSLISQSLFSAKSEVGEKNKRIKFLEDKLEHLTRKAD